MTQSLNNWVYSRQLRGSYIFDKAEIVGSFPSRDISYISVGLNRLRRKGELVSPWQNFYVSLPIEYRLKGSVSPFFYIDQLMRFLGRSYYVSLLTAADLHGAAHQRPQSFFVTVEGSPLRSICKNGTDVRIFCRNSLVASEITQVKGETGMINVSSPLLTALDLVRDESHVGGLGRTAEILLELSEKLSFCSAKAEVLLAYPTATLQRLGYLLELIDEPELGQSLYEVCRECGVKFWQQPLKPSAKLSADDTVNTKWQLRINEQLEIDEI